MATIIEATVQCSNGQYFINPNTAMHENITLAQWIEQGEEAGYTVTENLELDGRVHGQDGGKVYHCALDEETFADVVVWEEE